MRSEVRYATWKATLDDHATHGRRRCTAQISLACTNVYKYPFLHDNDQMVFNAGYAVITADIVGSRQVPHLEDERDNRINRLSALHKSLKFIASPYTVTAWDEFQVILKSPQFIPDVILDLRRVFFPLELWIGVGIGEVTGATRRPINRYAGGEAFERARTASNRLRGGGSKVRTLTYFNSALPLLDTVANAIYLLQDSLLQGTSDRQWAVINAQMDFALQQESARSLQIDSSTYSRTLRRSHYWQLEDTRKAMREIIVQLLEIDK